MQLINITRSAQETYINADHISSFTVADNGDTPILRIFMVGDNDIYYEISGQQANLMLKWLKRNSQKLE